jgi:hypothetical protein
VLLNRALEAARALALDRRLLRRRGRARNGRAPLVIVPGMFGTRLAQRGGRVVWGDLRSLYSGPPIAQAEAHPDGLLLDLPLLPGLLGVDVHGGLLRLLASAGGYQPGEDLFVLDYDWRRGFAHGAARLAQFVSALRGIGDEKVDLLAISTGGSVVRTWLAYGGQDPLAAERPSGEGAACARRVVYVGTAQRGAFDALTCLHRGFRFAPGGKRFSGREAALCQTTLDALPHPDDPVFVDERGQPLRLPLYDEATWARLGLLEGAPGLDERLDRAQRLHRALDRPVPYTDAVVIGARHLPTPCRAVVENGRARVPSPEPRRDDPYVGFCYAPGDGELPESSLRALPGLADARVWLARPSAHARLPADPEVHRLALEALLATDRRIPETPLVKSGFKVIGG